VAFSVDRTEVRISSVDRGSGCELMLSPRALRVRRTGEKTLRRETLLTDGPFVDAKEHLGGFGLVEAHDLDAALEIAARIPAARMGGAVEVRPLLES
jgi:hypothetical protein